MSRWRHLQMECHASSHILQKIDGVHYKFLGDLELDPGKAYLDYNFAPPSLRRDIGILGLFHKRVLGLSHPIFQKLLPCCRDVPGSYCQGDHNRQLYGHLQEANFQMALFCRSIFAMVFVYTRLPQAYIDCTTVASFQTCLSKMARRLCKDASSYCGKVWSPHDDTDSLTH